MKKYWIAILILVIVILVVIIFHNERDHRSQINASNDSIRVLNKIILRQDEIVAESRRKDVRDSLLVVSIRDSADVVIRRLKQRNYEYWKEINGRDSIPLDDRYVEFREWLRTVRF